MASRVDRSQWHSAPATPKYPAGLRVRSCQYSVGMDHDSRWPGGMAREFECVGDLVEGDDLADTGQRIQLTRRDRVERAIPVLWMRAAAELDGDALAGSRRDVQRVSGVPAARAVDSGAELGRFDDVLD